MSEDGIKEGQVWVSKRDPKETATIEGWDKGGLGLNFAGWGTWLLKDSQESYCKFATDYFLSNYELKKDVK